MENNEKDNKILSYQDMLDKLSAGKSHLLLGNGFNLSLGIDTKYQMIVKEMKEITPYYEQIENEFSNSDYDIEEVIGKLQNAIDKNNSNYNFLHRFIQNKIKIDFMKAAISIINSSIKNIYQEKNTNIYILFEKFNNYFTLNYDPFLYLLLMKFKKKEDETIAFQNKSHFFPDLQEFNKKERDMIELINKSYNEGILQLKTSNDSSNTIENRLNELPLPDFKNQITKILKKKFPKIKNKQIKKLINRFKDQLDENKKMLKINDGFQGELFHTNNSNKDIKQNVFFIHGAFHIYKNGKSIKKITQTSEKALYQRLEEIIDAEEKDLICIFQANDKESVIKENKYLSLALNKLNEIEGDLVIFGSSLSENDSHIFSRINKNKKITKVFISTTKSKINQDIKKAQKLFPEKELFYFDYKTVSYRINSD